MEDHVRHTVVPPPVGPEDLHALAGRLLAPPLDLTRSPRMDGAKNSGQVAGANAFVRLAGGAPGLLAAAAHTALRLRQPLIQTIVTNVPGPSFPLYSMGRRMLETAPYIPIAAGLRVSIGVVSYDPAACRSASPVTPRPSPAWGHSARASETASTKSSRPASSHRGGSVPTSCPVPCPGSVFTSHFAHWREDGLRASRQP